MLCGYQVASLWSRTTSAWHQLAVTRAIQYSMQMNLKGCKHTGHKSAALSTVVRQKGGRKLLPKSRQQVSSEWCSGSRRTPTVSPESQCGISQAVHARVPESILFLRSDHELTIAAQTYIVSHELKVLYVTARALRLSVTSVREGGCRLLIEALKINSCPLGAAPLNLKFWSRGKGIK